MRVTVIATGFEQKAAAPAKTDAASAVAGLGTVAVDSADEEIFNIFKR